MQTRFLIRLSLLGIALAFCVFAARAQEPTLGTSITTTTLKLFTEGPSSISSIWWYEADGNHLRAKLEHHGDFTFYDEDGREVLRLQRAEKGDPIHELMALLLVRTVSHGWELKDWREYGESK